MFNPSRDQVRDFFIDTWSKHQKKQILTPLESIALNWIQQHPEYHPILENPEAKSKDFSVDQGQVNPFLHLSMHLAIEEQLSINSPPGIKEIFLALAAGSSPHDAAHEIMECLGTVLWEAQRLGTPLDNEHYLELLRQRVKRH